METCKDKFFGEMTYRHSWWKLGTFTWGETPVSVRIVAKAYTGQEIIDSQRENYSAYIKNEKNYSLEAQKALLTFCQRNYDTSITLKKLLVLATPKDILFQRDSSWGILFKYNGEDEINLAVKFKNGKIEAGIDNILI